MVMVMVLDFIQNNIPHGWKLTSSGWHSGNCPMCVTLGHNPDTKGRGGIKIQDGKFGYNCFNCNFKTGWSEGKIINDRLAKLLEKMGVEHIEIQRLNLLLKKQRDEIKFEKKFLAPVEIKKITDDWKPYKYLPETAHPINDYPTYGLSENSLQKLDNARKYLKDRKLDFHPDWMWSPDMIISNRVIMPYYYKKILVGYCARWVGDDLPKGIQRYYTQSPEQFVFNLDAQLNHDKIILTEGVFDAVLVGGISVLGNTPSDAQCSIISGLGKKIIVLPDFDKAGKTLVNAAIERGWSVSFPEWDSDIKDANDAVLKYGRMFTVNSILENVFPNKITIQVLTHQRCK